MSRFNTGNPIGSADPRDRDDNSKNLDEAVNTTEDRWTDRLGNDRVSLAAAVDPSGFAQSALNDANRAEAAADAATLNADVYADTAAGIAGTSDGEQFQVVEGDELVRYRNESGAAVEVARYPSSSALDNRLGEYEHLLTTVVETESDDFSWGVADEDGGVAVGVTQNGAVTSKHYRVGGDDYIRSAESDQFPWAVTDSDGSVALGVDYDGVTHVTSIGISGESQTLVMDIPGVSEALVDADGLAAVIVRDDGQVETKGTQGQGPGLIDHAVSDLYAEPVTDPSKDLYVSWTSNSSDRKVIEYRPQGGESWMSASSIRSRPFRHLEDLYIHTVEIVALSPDTTYEFRVPGSIFSDKVKTAPARFPLRVAVTSDFHGNTSNLETLGGHATQDHFDVHLWLGDMNSGYGDDSNIANIYRSFISGLSSWRTRDDALIPIVALVGNHDVYPSGTFDTDMIKDVFTWGYDPTHETRFIDSAAYFRVRKNFVFIGINTDNDLGSQFQWFSEVADREIPGATHAAVGYHRPAFNAFSNQFVNDTSRALRRDFWTKSQEFAGPESPMRAHFVGHTHALTMSSKMRMEYDDQLSDSDNDLRWVHDESDGFRQIGNGPIHTPADQNRSTIALESIIDGSLWYDAILTRSTSDDNVPEVFGDGVTNEQIPLSHYWRVEFSEDRWTADAVNLNGDLFYTFSETI